MKTSEERILLDVNAVGDEKRIRAILQDWRVEGAAIGQILKEHRALVRNGVEVDKRASGSEGKPLPSVSSIHC